MAENKKVGIVTFHRAVNVGSFLQSYAMATAVKRLGFQPEIIDYYSAQQQQQYAKLYLNNNRSKSLKFKLFLIVYRLVLVVFARKIRRYNRDYHDFAETHLPISEHQYNDISSLKSAKLEHSTFISGSDQIWNTNALDFSEAYLLNFVKDARKVAYAPSLGNNNHFSNKYIEQLKQYDDVSVREKAGAQYISKLLGKNVPYVLDPTLLLKKDDYAELEQPSDIQGDYLFYYAIGYNIKQRMLVNRIARKHGLKVVSWNPQQYALDRLFIRNLVQPEIQNPGVWLNLIKNAKLVVSASFHGSVFSVLYGRDLSILSYKKNNRLAIFSEIGLGYQALQGKEIPKISRHIDVDAKKLQKLKNSSMIFLRSALNEEAR